MPSTRAQLGEAFSDNADETLDERIKRMDKDGDGKLSAEEIGDVRGVPGATAQAGEDNGASLKK